MLIPSHVSGRAIGTRGVHLHAGQYHEHWMAEADLWQRRFVELNLSWCVMLVGGDSGITSGAIRACLDAGVIPIIRPWLLLPHPFTDYEHVETTKRIYDEYGAPLLYVIYNEWLLPGEWDGEMPKVERAWEIRASRWMEAARGITNRGAYVGFPDGPGYGENPFLRVMGTEDLWRSRRAVYCGHHYGLSRDVNYPLDVTNRCGTPLTMARYRRLLGRFVTDPDWYGGEEHMTRINEQRWGWHNPDATPITDDTCFLGFEKVLHWSREAFSGFEVDIGMTEGGYTPKATAWPDIRYVPDTPERVAVHTLSMFRHQNPLLFKCPWLLASYHMNGGGYTWEGDAWYTDAWQSYGYGPEMPVAAHLRRHPS